MASSRRWTRGSVHKSLSLQVSHFYSITGLVSVHQEGGLREVHTGACHCRFVTSVTGLVSVDKKNGGLQEVYTDPAIAG